MRLSVKTVLPVTAASIMTLSSCSRSVRSRAFDYAVINRKSYTEVLNVIQAQSEGIQQAKLDSLAFRDIFNSTQVAKDSDKIVKFEAIAQDMQSTPNEIDRILTDEGIKSSSQDANMQKEENFQYFADNSMYRKFFNQIGIMNDSLKNICDIASLIIKP